MTIPITPELAEKLAAHKARLKEDKAAEKAMGNRRQVWIPFCAKCGVKDMATLVKRNDGNYVHQGPCPSTETVPETNLDTIPNMEDQNRQMLSMGIAIMAAHKRKKGGS